MSELLTVVDNLNIKVTTLIEKLNNVQSELSMVQEENLKLNNELVEKSAKVNSLNEKITNLESDVVTAQTLNTDSDNVRMRIDEMVREIDECISLIKE
jgi:predicted  nucleic acid-binding Zn-ribbon protein